LMLSSFSRRDFIVGSMCLKCVPVPSSMA
jgi:hypothetical protein